MTGEMGSTVNLHRKPSHLPVWQLGHQRSSNDVCVTPAITPTTERKRTFRHFAFVPEPDIGTPTAIGIAAGSKLFTILRSSHREDRILPEPGKANWEVLDAKGASV
jgi:hypothetical protein